MEAIDKIMQLDADKILEFDLAASIVNKVIVSYPGCYAISIYQVLTPGALQVAKELAEVKHHPARGVNLIIYERCTILGGKPIQV
jgi:hypothetical protein